MSYLQNTDYRACESIDRAVNIQRSEGQCRNENHCEQVECPLVSEFSDRLMEPGSRLIAGVMGFGWLAGGANR